MENKETKAAIKKILSRAEQVKENKKWNKFINELNMAPAQLERFSKDLKLNNFRTFLSKSPEEIFYFFDDNDYLINLLSRYSSIIIESTDEERQIALMKAGAIDRERIGVPFLDYRIVNCGNSDGWVITKDGELWESHLGNYGTLDQAKRDAFLHFMIARPEHFAINVIRRINGSGVYHEWYKLEEVLKDENLEVPKELKRSEDINFTIEFVSQENK